MSGSVFFTKSCLNERVYSDKQKMSKFIKVTGGISAAQMSDEDGYSYETIKAIAEHITSSSKHKPQVGIICGSGLGYLADKLVNSEVFPYESIPNFPVTTVPLHEGRLVMGLLTGVPVLCMQGRIHYYEGHPLWKCGLSVRVMKLMGIEKVIVTNAAGGLNPRYKIGDIVLIKDHINLQNFGGDTPLKGPNEPRFGPPYPGMSVAYDKHLRVKAKEIGKRLGFSEILHEGVYTMMTGPMYETPAELRALRILGVDAVGMSTIPEVIMARHCGMTVFAFSLITNICITEEDCVELVHPDLLKVGSERQKEIHDLVSHLLLEMSHINNNDTC